MYESGVNPYVLSDMPKHSDQSSQHSDSSSWTDHSSTKTKHPAPQQEVMHTIRIERRPSSESSNTSVQKVVSYGSTEIERFPTLPSLSNSEKERCAEKWEIQKGVPGRKPVIDHVDRDQVVKVTQESVFQGQIQRKRLPPPPPMTRRMINRNKDGWIDPTSIHAIDLAPTPPPVPPKSEARLPQSQTFDAYAAQMQIRQANEELRAREAAEKKATEEELERVNSHASKMSFQSFTSSLKNLGEKVIKKAKRMSHAVDEVLDQIQHDTDERRKNRVEEMRETNQLKADAREQREKEMYEKFNAEAQRKMALLQPEVRKFKYEVPKEWNRNEFVNEVNRKNARAHLEACCIAERTGQEKPRKPSIIEVGDVKHLPRDPRMSPEEVAARSQPYGYVPLHQPAEAAKPPPMSTGMKAAAVGFANFASKLHRSNSTSSDFSIGAFQPLPDDVQMEQCNRCHKPPVNYLERGACEACLGKKPRITKCTSCGEEPGFALKGGICNNCRKKTRRSAEQRSASSNNRPVIDNEVHGGENMMTKPRKKVKIHHITYEDPGNPFSPESGEVPIQYRATPLNLQDIKLAEYSELAPQFSAVESSLELHAPRARRSGTPTFIKDDKNSTHTSRTEVSTPESAMVEEYIPIRRFWVKQEESSKVPDQTASNRRDTQFYGFYEEVLDGYAKKK